MAWALRARMLSFAKSLAENPGMQPWPDHGALACSTELSIAAGAEHRKLEAVIASLGDGLLVLDDGLRVESVNRRGEEILGQPAGAMVGMSIEDLAARWTLRDRGPFAVSKMRLHLQRGLPYRNDDAFVVGVDDAITHVSLVMTPIWDEGVRRGAVIGIRDITEMKLAQIRLRESEQRFRRIFQWAPMGMVRLTDEGVIESCNEAFQEMLGRPEGALLGGNLGAFLHPDEVPDHEACIRSMFADGQPAWQGERRFLHASNEIVSTQSSLSLVERIGDDHAFVVAVVEDVTARKRLELELRHAQKLEAIGRLAAGIAHEINTPIQFIGDNLQFLREAFHTVAKLAASSEPADDGGPRELAFLRDEVPLAIDQSLEGLARASEIVRAMKAFGDPGGSDRVPADLNDLVRNAVVVASSHLRAVAEVELLLGDLPAVSCDIGDLNQVLLHLLMNAADAISDSVRADGERGCIAVETAREGDGVEIRVSDTGTGVAPEIRHRLFDPFFTTKEVGRGSGQGLALAHAVAERHGGRMSFDTEWGQGATFRMWLPV